jgi:PadR family transcriptional regulator PadR
VTIEQEGVLTQLRKGVLEYCVLACLRGGPAYGLELASRLTAAGLLSSEGTLYPLLSRLRTRGWVESTWQESTSGPPRRYYQATPQGAAALASFTSTWGPFAQAVTHVLEARP